MPGTPRSRFSPIARFALLSSLSTLSWADDECANAQRQREQILQDIAALREANDHGLKKLEARPVTRPTDESSSKAGSSV
jgi:hypothetical protein